MTTEYETPKREEINLSLFKINELSHLLEGYLKVIDTKGEGYDWIIKINNLLKELRLNEEKSQ